MSIKTDAIVIRDETVNGANTALRVGTNLVAISDDLLDKQIEIDANTAKVGITPTQASDITSNNSHRINTLNPHSVTKSQVGLDNVDNTSDLNKPISTATQSALDTKLDASSLKNLSLGESYANIVSEKFFREGFDVYPTDAGYQYAKLIQQDLLSKASLLIIPQATKEGVLGVNKGSHLDVVRATTATMTNSDGLIESVSANIPRLDYTGSTCPSLLVEPQRTNLLLNSETLATQSITVTAQSYTLSFYGSGTVSLSGTHIASVVGLGTARKNYTFTPTAGTLILTISGTCTKGQLEAGENATSYIPTTSASVTRNADLISKTGISSLIGQTEGTVFVDCKDVKVGLSRLFEIFNLSNTGTNIFLNLSASGALQIILNGAIVAAATGNVVDLDKVIFKYTADSIKLFNNGALIGSYSGAVAFSNVLDTLAIGGTTYTTRTINGNIKLVGLWKTALTDQECINLTTL